MNNVVKKFIKRTTSVVVAICIAVLNIPISSQNQTFAASPSIPANMFALKSELSKFNTNDGEEGKILFGKRTNDITYDGGSTSKSGPISWLIAGQESTNDLVLFSEEPIIGPNKYYQFGQDDQQYILKGKFDSSSVAYPTSYMHEQLEAIANNSWPSSVRDTSFTNAEQNLMVTTEVKSFDIDFTSSTTTQDKLYLPAYYNINSEEHESETVLVGTNNQLPIPNKFWKSNFWLRDSSYGEHQIAYACGTYINFTSTTDDTISTQAALKIDISNVAFASAASSSTINDNFVKISSYDPVMELRLIDSSTFSNSTIELVNNGEENNPQIVWENAPANSRLVVLASDGQNTYQRSKEVSGSGSEYVLDSEEGYTLPGGEYAVKVWLETTNNGLTYVKNAAEGQGIATGTAIVKLTPSNLSFTGLNSNFTYTYDDDLSFTVGITGNNLGTGAITYSSSDNNVATVNSSSGQVTINKVGTFRITANIAADDTHNAVSVQSDTITVNKANQAALSISGLNSSYTMGTTGIKVTVSGGTGNGAISYLSSNNSVAQVDSIGNVTLVGDGTFTITVTKAGGDNYNDISKTSNTISVNNANQAPLTLSGLNSSYDFGAAGIKVSVSGGSGSGSISYESSNNDVASIDNSGNITIKKVGTFTITVTKAGDNTYNPQSTTSELITVNPISAENIQVTVEQSTYIYDSNTWQPNFEIKHGDITLVENQDYTITLPEDMTSVGEKNVTINFIGNYTGSKSITLEIVVDKS